ncbi:MAG: EFR1 family ferrodoxin [Candidatus Fimivivens sp.]
MKTTIFYFTGTGNSLQVAMDLSKKMDNVTITQISESTKVDLSAERIGFVFPVYLWGVPNIVERFLKRIPINMQGKYLFAIATYKSQAGDTIGQVARILKHTQNRLSSGFTIEMPGNNIIYYNSEPARTQNQKIQNCRMQLIKIADIINAQAQEIPKSSVFQAVFFTGILHAILSKIFKNSDKNFWINDKCTACGVCAKVCPVGNISIKDSNPIWNHNCQQCVACINSCPNHAIQYGKTTIGRNRYVNQEIGVAGLLKQIK